MGKIIICTGQKNAYGKKVNDYANTLINDNTEVLINPEKELLHQKMLYDMTFENANKFIEKDINAVIITYSDHVFNAVRVAVKNHNKEDCEIHTVMNDGTITVAHIFPNGRLDAWIEDVFDVWDKALLELI